MNNSLFAVAATCTALALGVGGCQDATTPAAPDVSPAFAMAEHQTEPIDYVSNDPCDGEQIHWIGERTFVTTVTNDGAGGYHYTSHRNWKATGTGLTSGATYLANFPRNVSYTFKGPFPEIYTVVWNNFVTRKGGQGGYLLKTSEKIVVNGNGEVVQDTSTYDYVCKVK